MYSKPIPGLLSPQQVWFFRHAGYLRVGNAVPKERLLWLREVIDDLLRGGRAPCERSSSGRVVRISDRSEEHTSELQSRGHLVCRLLLEKKNTKRVQY